MGGFELDTTSAEQPEDPIEIFNQLTLRGQINNIWDPQAEALRKWNQVRAANDVVVEMNTGGGKTLVGLLIAQSLLNELNRRVVYVVPNNQLIEQTRDRANELGIRVATRYSGHWEGKEEFESAERICLTNYASLFNGKSIFRSLDVEACVFDDAHVAETNLFDHYTLGIPSDSAAFTGIVRLLQPHFRNENAGSKLDAILSGEPNVLLFVPMYLIWKWGDQIKRIIQDDSDVFDENKFAWQHVKDHLRFCCVVLSADGAEIRPPAIPRHTLPYFGESVRRVYLTATTPSDASFVKTFGVNDYERVQPSGRSGDAQRLFLFAEGHTDAVHVQQVKEQINGRKACVIAPSSRKLEKWKPEVDVFERTDDQSKIDKFSRQSTGLLGLAGRYDGIDLPGDACRILIVDHLPKGEALLDRFLDEAIRIQTIRTEHAATRIVQAIGRIFRSNTDHGVVYLTGTTLQEWIRNPANTQYLPTLLQQQISLGIALDKQIREGKQDVDELIQDVVTGDPDWDASYNKYITQMAAQRQAELPKWFPSVVRIEQTAFAKLWNGEFRAAASLYKNAVEVAADHDKELAGWYQHFCGLCQLADGNDDAAIDAFAAAARTKVSFGRYKEDRDKIMTPSRPEDCGFQAKSIAERFLKKRNGCLNDLDTVESNLIYTDDTKSTEDAFQRLGLLLGLISERPDNQQKTGPDNQWSDPNGSVVYGFDLKTGKQAESTYDKKEIGQSFNHFQWMTDQLPQAQINQAIVGRSLTVDKNASPPSQLQLIELVDFQRVAGHLRDLYAALDNESPDELEAAVETRLRHFGLVWPAVVNSMSSRRVCDLVDD